jgi:HlyD family secretion protein
MKKGRIIALVIFALAILASGVYTLFFLKAKEAAPQAFYQTEAPQRGDIRLRTMASGSIQPRQEILIKPQISGIVRSLRVEAGDTVRAGDVLAEVMVVPDMGALAAAEARLQRANIALDDAVLSHDRNALLLADGVLSESAFQPFQTGMRQAREEVLAAEESLRIIQDGVASRSGRASNTLITSTISGMVLDVPIRKGNSVIEANNFNEGTTIASVADMSDLLFIGQIDESEVEKLKPGMELILTIGALEGHEYKAVLEYISPKGVKDGGAIQFEVKAAVQLKPGEFLRAGYSATAEVVLNERVGVLKINESLIQFEDGQPFVEVETAPNSYQRVDVVLGLSDGLEAEVVSGLDGSEAIKKWNQPQYEQDGAD